MSFPLVSTIEVLHLALSSYIALLASVCWSNKRCFNQIKSNQYSFN